MENSNNTYCRFCAEPKSADKLLNLDNDEEKFNEVLLKLAFLNAIYVDVSPRDNLPKTVCLICYDSLNKAYEFLDRVKRSQDVLSTIFTDAAKYELSDDDAMPFIPDDLITTDDDAEELRETTSKKLEAEISVKVEMKEEHDLLEDIVPSYDQPINVQAILDAALYNPYTSNVTLYAKEVTDDKAIVSWRTFPWVCSYCNIEFHDAEMLRSHAKAVHGKCAAFTCIDCDLWKKNDFNSFVKHVRKHRKILRNQCQYCDEPIPSENMNVHVKQHFLKSQLPCPTCGEILKKEDSLRQHLQDYISVKPKRKPRRKAGTPITVEDLTCHICKKVYKNPNSLRDHVKRHTKDRKRNYTCDRCGKTFYNKGTLTSHIKAHDKIRPHVCRICNKSFLFPNMLRRHVEMHSGIKPFSCEQCGRCFRLQYQLNAHKIVHTDSMPYTCQYCSKAFRFKQILKNHERQHTGAKPYCCQHCGMEFSNWSNYNKHMKRRHNTDTSKKKITPDGVFPINPETGQIIQVFDQGVDEWKTKIMIPTKRGKKKVVDEVGV